MKTLTILISLLTFSPAFGSVHSQGHAVSLFDSLPPEVIVEIAGWLDVHSLQNFNSTCKYLHILTQHELEEKRLLVQRQVWLSAAGGDPLATTPYDINGLTAANRNKVWQFNNLWFLDLSYTKISDNLLNCLMYLPMLKSLILGHTNISSKGMPNLKQLRSLVKLDLQSTMIDDDALQGLTPLKNLQELNLSGNDKISGITLDQISGLKKMRKLDMSKTKLEWMWLSTLHKIPNLLILDLRGTKSDCLGFQHIVNCRSLVQLNVADTAVVDKWLVTLIELQSLADVDLRNTLVTRVGIKQFRALCKSAERVINTDL